MSLQEITKLKEEYQKKIESDGKELLHSEFKQVFESVPQLESVKWTQYTPYFNDGEACVFSVNEPQFKVEGFKQYSKKYEYINGKRVESGEWSEEPNVGDYDDEFFSASDITGKYGWYKTESPLSNEQQELIITLSNTIQGNEDVMLAVFGDHTEIMATRDGFEVESYDHD